MSLFFLFTAATQPLVVTVKNMEMKILYYVIIQIHVYLNGHHWEL